MLIANIILAFFSALFAVSVLDVLELLKQNSDSEALKKVTISSFGLIFLFPTLFLVFLGLFLFFVIQAASTFFDVYLVFGLLFVIAGLHFLNLFNLKFLKPKRLNGNKNLFINSRLGFKILISTRERLIPIWALLVIFVTMGSDHWINPLFVLIIFSTIVSVLLVLIIKHKEFMVIVAKNKNFFELLGAISGLYLILTGLIIMSGNGYIVYSFFEKILYMF